MKAAIATVIEALKETASMPSRYGNPKDIRRQAMIKMIRENGPMTVAEFSSRLGCVPQTIRYELALNNDVLFECVEEQRRGKMWGSSGARYYLTASALGASEEEYESMADELFRDNGEWFPKADPLLVQTINAMVRMRSTSQSEINAC